MGPIRQKLNIGDSTYHSGPKSLERVNRKVRKQPNPAGRPTRWSKLQSPNLLKLKVFLYPKFPTSHAELQEYT